MANQPSPYSVCDLPAIVPSQSNKHDTNLSDFLLRLELHLGLDRLDLVAFDNGRLIAVRANRRKQGKGELSKELREEQMLSDNQ